MSHQMPTDADIRARIDRIENEKYRLAFMYQYLIAGRIAEVSGKYGPHGNDAISTAFDGVPAIMFVVRTAKRKGRLRGVAVPLDEKYEPWARPVYEYFLKQGEDYVFRFAEKWATSIRYMQWEAERTFSDLEWPMIHYTKSIEVEVNSENVLDSGVNERNKEILKIRLEDGSTAWFPKVKENVVRMSEKIPKRWKNVTSHVMRKRRTLTLMFEYELDGVDLSLYGGWTESSQAEAMPQALKHYLYVDPQSSSEPLKLLKKMAGRYFKKLLKPYIS